MTTQQLNKPDNSGVILFPPLLFICVLAAGIGIGYVFPANLLPVKTALIIGFPFFVSAFTMLSAAVKTLRKHKTTINPSGATTGVVTSGIYQYTRNPMYLSFTLFYISMMIMTQSFYSFLLLFPLIIIVQKGIIEKEEIYLAAKFGEIYFAYK